MMVEAANRLNIRCLILDAPDSPAKHVSADKDHVSGSFRQREDIIELARKCDVVTTEIEHVDAETLAFVQREICQVEPAPSTIAIIQDKYKQKKHLNAHGVPTVEYRGDKFEESGFGYPFMVKSRKMAYDGRGNFVIKDAQALNEVVEEGMYAEKWYPFDKELAVMVVRSAKGETLSYPTVETVHTDSICRVVYAPARIPDLLALTARALAERAVKTFEGAGVFGVEMFNKGSDLVINEIAPRPHNSGHYTIEACCSSQYEAHLRAILDLPLPLNIVDFKAPNMCAVMLNVLGASNDPQGHMRLVNRALEVPGAQVHMYGKRESRRGRKMGHITITGSSMAECEQSLDYIEPDTWKPAAKPASPIAILMGSISDLPTMKPAAEKLQQFGIIPDVTIVSAHRTPGRMVEFAKQAASRGVKVIIAGAGGAAHLPGMTASETSLPVIGVPVKASVLDGLDSLLSIVQMPVRFQMN